jgi:hypothetical protein
MSVWGFAEIDYCPKGSGRKASHGGHGGNGGLEVVGRMAFVPEGRADRSQARSAWTGVWTF